MKLQLFFLCLLLFSFSTYAQNTAQEYTVAQTPDSTQVKFNTVKDSTYFATYNKLKSLYLEMMYSPCYLEGKFKTSEYSRKLRVSPDFKSSIIAKDEGALNWLKENWQFTGFTSYEEALKEYNNLKQVHMKCQFENPEYTNYQLKAIMKYGPTIYSDMILEIITEYPDKFVTN